MYYKNRWGSSKEFFNRDDASNYFATFHSKMYAEVEQMSDSEIVSCNLQEWAKYLADKFYIHPIKIF